MPDNRTEELNAAVDWKYVIDAVNPCSGNKHTQFDSVLFLAHDKALPAAIEAYRKESTRLGANLAHLEAIDLMLERVLKYQANVFSKVPDTDLPCEIRRCVEGEGHIS